MSGIGNEEEEEDTSLGHGASQSEFSASKRALLHSPRPRAPTEDNVEDDGVLFKVFDSQEDAAEYLKISEDTLQAYLKFAEENGGMLISVRDKKSLQALTKRRSDLETDFYNKPGPVKTKMNSTFPKGHIPRDRSLLSDGHTSYNFMDNSYAGTFPEDSITTTECMQLLGVLKKYEDKYHSDDKIVEVRKVGKRICYRENVVQYQKSGDDYVPVTQGGIPVTSPKHYIQEAESLHSVLKNIARGAYKSVAIEDGKILFKFGDKNLSININDLPAESHDKLNTLIDTAKSKSTTVSLLTNMKERAEVLKSLDAALFSVYDKIDGCECPIWQRKSVSGSEHVEMPVMVMAGDNGFEIASDLDILQLPAPFGLPTSMHNLCITSKDSAELQEMFNLAIADMEKLIAQLEDNAPGKQDFISILKEVEDTRNYYFVGKTLAETKAKLSVLGTTNVYGITKQYIFNRDNKLDPNTPWPHGADDLHPAATPENFGAVIMLKDGSISYIGNEKAYVLYLLHNPQILQNPSNELSIHPHWLTTNDTCNQYWKDIVYIQGLFAVKLDISRGIKPPGQQYFDNLQVKASLKSRGAAVIAESKEAIGALKQQVAGIDPKSIDAEIEKTYTKYLNSGEDAQLLSEIQEKMKPKSAGAGSGFGGE